MAVTIANSPGSNRVAKFQITFALDADTTATIDHGMNGVPGDVRLLPRNAQAYVGQVHVLSITATQVVVTKLAAVGSGGAIVDLSVLHPNFVS